jgi:drug/metabolite transporter (DMT)-like permease
MFKRSSQFWLILLSFFMIYIVWGTTFLANAWGVKSVPPFIFSGSRFFIAGVILLGISALIGPIRITWTQLKNCAFAGTLLFTVGNGAVAWSLQHIDSGITALFISFEPLIVAVMLWKWKTQKPVKETWIGIALGITGMALLVGQPNFVSSPIFVTAASCVFFALFSWAYISIWIADADLPKSILQSASWQMIMGGLGLFIMSFIFKEYERIELDDLDLRAIYSFAYLVFFGSILAFSAFNYLLKNVSPTKVVTSAYINPVVAVIVGWWLNNEQLTGQSMIAASVLLTGVFFITRAKSKY